LWLSPIRTSEPTPGHKTAGASSILAQKEARLASEGPITIVITFKDGHQPTFSVSEVARVAYAGDRRLSGAGMSPE